MTDERRPRIPRDQSESDAPTGHLRPPISLSVEVAGRTDKGQVRPGNEDAFAVELPTTARARAYGTLLLVADGMGGHAAGEVASQIAVDTIQKAYYRARGSSVADAIRGAIVEANAAIFDNAEHSQGRAGMGCTIVAVAIQGGSYTIGHVGDSRAYLIRGGQARQVTRDHSWVAMQVAEGVLTPEQAEHHPNRSVLMRALGRHPTVEVDIGHDRLQAGDVLVLCSDGLTNVVHDEEIAAYAARYGTATLADQLVSLANQRGAPDNVTVVVAAATVVAGEVADPTGAAATVTLPVPEAPTTRLPRAVAETATNHELHRPGSASATERLGANHGAPVVLSRTSTPVPIGSPNTGRRRGRGLLMGGIAALGIAAALALLLLLRPGGSSELESARRSETAAATATSVPPNAGPGATAPGIAATFAPAATTVAGAVAPPPLPTGLPAISVPGAGGAATPTTVPTSQPATPTRIVDAAATAVGILPTLVGIQPPAIAASPAAVATATPVPTAPAAPAKPSGADSGATAPESFAAPDAGAAPADAGGAPPDAPPDMQPDAAAAPPDGQVPDATAPTETPPEEDAPPPAVGAPAPQPQRPGVTIPGGRSIPPNPFFPGSRKKDD